MTDQTWQKSSYCQEASACVHVSAAPDGTIHLRESDAPETTLTTGPSQLRAFITHIRTGTEQGPRSRN
ncbi:DUF397 domain-containing protein [Streptomyces sp. MZ04]|uniref:DUF397 domain-containing protein n=1 Tax=Streptomyces sp. MZ04 TaxID=2559236 RepID=UPI00107ECDFB|nr:DUF397 domain-containing protein [Streptomyces sp. MZ04]TGA84162.1 DUF397 domain-containing protein [Streptomyces sp. MZ04]